MTEHTKVVAAAAYAPPAIERREDVAGLLGQSRGSYCPPTTVKTYNRFRRHR